MNYLKESWDKFSSDALTKELSKNEIETLRRVFYSGWILLFSLLDETINDPDMTREETNQMLADMNREIGDVMVEILRVKFKTDTEKGTSCA